MTSEAVLIGKSDDEVISLNAAYANRHGLVAGATGTGKTVTLQILTEGFSQLGIPVFAADIKGDLSGVSQAASASEKLQARASKTGLGEYSPAGFPVIGWDLFGKQGHPIRTTISDMGPLLLAHLFELNETQEGVLNIAFKVADEEGLLLLDLKDLRAMLNYVAENAKELSQQYGRVSASSVAAIQRRLLVLEQQGASQFFGEPALNLHDLIKTDESGRGYIHLLNADELMQRPRVYASMLLWLLAELFEELPEVGDQDKPKFVFFFDEAHLLFKNVSKALLNQIEQVVRLIRSKGVSVFFVTQNPMDIPEAVLAQLGNRVQHALRAYTPKEQKALKVAAQSFRTNPDLDTEAALSTLAVGEALVSTLQEDGVPSVVKRTLVRPPVSQMGPINESQRDALIQRSPLKEQYHRSLDRESAYEVLLKRAEKMESAEERSEPSRKKSRSTGRKRQSVFEAMMKSMARSMGSQLGRQLLRGVLGALIKR